jgi:hypothetical protein
MLSEEQEDYEDDAALHETSKDPEKDIDLQEQLRQSADFKWVSIEIRGT